MSVTFYGLSSLVGRTVTVWCAGLDCGDYLVPDGGAVDVPFGSDPDGLFTSDYLLALDNTKDWGPLATKISVFVFSTGTNKVITVPLVIGFCYNSRGQVVRPLLEAEIKSSQGPGLGKLRRVHQYGVLVNASVALTVSYGTDFSNLLPADYRDPAGNVLNHSTLFNGVFWNTLSDDYSYDGALAWSITRPYPHTMVSLTGIMETNEG